MSKQLVAAGFEQIAFERCDAPILVGRDLEEAIAFALELGPAGEPIRLAGELGEEKRPELAAALKTTFEGLRTADGSIRAHSSTWIVTASPCARQKSPNPNQGRAVKMHRLAMPFVATLAVSCTRSADTSNVPPPPTPSITSTPEPTQTATAPGTAPTTPATTASPSASGITYDGYGSCYRLVDGEKKYAKCPESVYPLPPTDQLVYKYGSHCSRVPDGRPVQCPPGGPTAIVPEPSSITTGKTHVSLRFGTLNCHQSEDMYCPPKVACNPPAPEPVQCPPALMPKLAPGVKPTKREGARCYFGVVEVACPP